MPETTAPEPPKAINGKKVKTTFEKKPVPIYVLENGHYAALVNGTWQTRTSLEGIRKALKPKAGAAIKAVMNMSWGRSFNETPVEIIGKRGKNLVKKKPYGGDEQITKYGGDAYVYDPDLLKAIAAAEEKLSAPIAKARKELEKLNKVRDDALDALRGKMVRITPENVDELLAEAAKKAQAGEEGDS